MKWLAGIISGVIVGVLTYWLTTGLEPKLSPPPEPSSGQSKQSTSNGENNSVSGLNLQRSCGFKDILERAGYDLPVMIKNSTKYPIEVYFIGPDGGNTGAQLLRPNEDSAFRGKYSQPIKMNGDWRVHANTTVVAKQFTSTWNRLIKKSNFSVTKKCHYRIEFTEWWAE